MIIGIDLGTTNSLVSHWHDGEAKLIPNALGSYLTPSVVALDDEGHIICGQAAKERLFTHPQQSAAVFKRFMGSKRQLRLGKQEFKPEELSSFILSSLKADAEAHLGETITEAVITVPAYFNDTQRKATKLAAELAGLKVERLLNEPTSAALAYGLHQKDEAEFLVFDLGGGTFDVSILELFDGVMEVRASAGHNALGGEDFSKTLVDYYYGQLENDSELKQAHDLPELKRKFSHRLVAEAERAKLSLTNNHSYDMTVDFEQFSFSCNVTREKFEELSIPLLQELQEPVKKALRDSNIRPNNLDAIILVGGATRMPMISKLVTKMFGRFPEKSLDPDQVVGLGASIQAALKQQNKALKDIVLTDVSPYSLGIEVVGYSYDGQAISGVFSPLIERNSTVPVSKEGIYSTANDDQDKIAVKIYQGESRDTRDNIFLGELEVAIKKAPAGQESITVRFSYDINGLLEVDTTINSTGESKSIVITGNDAQLSKEEIANSLEKLKSLKTHPRDQLENTALLFRGNRLYEQNLGEKREHIGRLLDHFKGVLESQDEQLIKRERKQMEELLDSLED